MIRSARNSRISLPGGAGLPPRPGGVSRAVRTRPARTCLLLLGLALAGSAGGIPAAAQTFEGLETSWRVADADCSLRLLEHRRTTAEAHDGRVSEFLAIAAGEGSYVHAVLEVPAAPIIGEAAASVWLKADRPGLQLLVRVVYPRSRRGRSGEPLSALLPGEVYRDVGRWQRLAVSELATLAARQARVLRAQFGDFDEREAYVDLLVLNAYGGAGTTQLWIDQLELRGWVAAGGEAALGEARIGGEFAVAEGEPSGGSLEADLPTLQLRGEILLQNGKPFAPRGIDHNGEPLAWLRDMGFHAVRMRQPPTPLQLSEARRLGLWLLAPPSYIGGKPHVGPEHAAVLGWSLGEGLRAADAPAVASLASRLRQADSRGRLLIAAPQSDLRGFSRLADVLLAEGAPLASSQTLLDYSKWLRDRRRLARPGVPVWASLPSSPPRELRAQIEALRGPVEELAFEAAQLEQTALLAVAGGARGLWFGSQSPLNGSAPEAELRRQALQLLNLKLDLIEPWMAAGEPVLDLAAEDPHTVVAALATERAWLVMLFRPAPGDSHVAAPTPEQALSIVVPGVSAAARSYQLGIEGLEPLQHRRVTGGLRVTVPPRDRVTLVVVSQDSGVVDALRRRATAIRPTASRLREEAAVAQLEQTRRLLAGGESNSPWEPGLRQAETALAQSRRLAAGGDHSAAARFTAQANNKLAELRRGAWEQAMRGFPSAVTSPAVTLFSALPAHAPTAERFRRGRLSGNLLPGGDMEHLDSLLAAEWTLGENRDNGAQTQVDLSGDAPYQGRSSLRLAAWPPGPHAAEVVELPPVWIATPPMELAPGELVRIQGRARIDHPVSGSRDGLLLFDSWGGLALAERITATDGWRVFTLYRAAPAEGGPLRVYAALGGYGQACLDDLRVERLLEDR